MSVEVHWFATLVKRTRSRQPVTRVEWRPGLTPQQILLDEGLSEADTESVVPVINDEQVDRDAPLTDGQVVTFIVSISGGAWLSTDGAPSASISHGRKYLNKGG
jgi:molybdopterin converting factor small subunit